MSLLFCPLFSWGTPETERHLAPKRAEVHSWGDRTKFRRATSERIRRTEFCLGVPGKQNRGESRARWQRSVPRRTRGRKGEASHLVTGSISWPRQPTYASNHRSKEPLIIDPWIEAAEMCQHARSIEERPIMLIND